MNVQYKDWRGTPFEVGSRVIYAVRHGSSLDIKEGEILEIKPADNYHALAADRLDQDMKKNGFDQEKFDKMNYHFGLCCKLKIRRLARPGGFWSWQNQDVPSTLKVVEKVTVLKCP